MSQFTESVGEHSEAGSRTACSHVWGPPICHSLLHEALYKKPSNSRDRLRKVAVPSKGFRNDLSNEMENWEKQLSISFAVDGTLIMVGKFMVLSYPFKRKELLVLAQGH
ncbi:hypothetical protein CEXT_548571 [Caerostris extrusa]|uniref:Uncharacterized protein n=1 Tax=Caerostris extrusa TaxID=172846 RepID=A0AAV4Y8E2_CAEEX|nr:hypothetical protein CEXT_548571 [Caerostris extrusa]